MPAKKRKTKQENVAVFIDAANIELSAKSQGWRVDYRKLYVWLTKQYKIQYVGFFSARFETKEHDAFLTVLKKIGFRLVTKPLKVIRQRDQRHIRKANFDVEIAVEAMKRHSKYSMCILFSGDSDFAYLLDQLHKLGKTTIVISTRHHVSRELIETANRYLDFRKIRSEIERKPVKDH